MAAAELLILDANVLIDYVHSELRPLRLWARHIGPVYVPRMLLREVDGLSEKGCAQLGLQLADPSIEQLDEAAQHQPGLAFADRLCLVLARDGKLTCATNDRRLRNECQNQGVEFMWGLEIMISLVHAAHLDLDYALRIGGQIQLSNPHHITRKILERFIASAKKAQP